MTPEQTARRKDYMREYRSRPGVRERQQEQERARRVRDASPERRAFLAEQRRTWGQRKRDQGIHTVTLVSADEFARMLRSQRGVCAVCKRPETRVSAKGRVRRLSVDHDHTTGRIRALLCSDCNTILGLAQDDPDRLSALADYAVQQQLREAAWAMESAVGSERPLISRRHRHAVPELQREAAERMQGAVG